MNSSPLGLAVIVAVSASLYGCAATRLDATRLGSNEYAALGENAPVAVYTKESDVGCAFEAVAVLHRHDMGKYKVLSMEDALPALKSQARIFGANAIIIDDSETVVSGVVSRGIDVEARAVRTSCQQNL